MRYNNQLEKELKKISELLKQIANNFNRINYERKKNIRKPKRN